MITDNLTGAVWQTHAGGTASIGGVAYVSATMAELPGGDLLLQMEGNAAPGPNNYPCNMWFTSRPIYSKTGCTLKFSLCLGSQSPGAMNAMELDGMYAIECADGQTRLFNGSAQWVPGTGWMIVDANGKWVPTGYNPAYLPNKRYTVKFVHAWDTAKNTMSVVSIDGVAVPAALQNVLAKVENWAAGFVNVQLQPSSKPAGLAWAWTIGRIRLKWS